MIQEYNYKEKIMGTDLAVAIVCESKEKSDFIFENIFEQLRSYEARFSRFIPESELSQLNNAKDMVVSEIFIDVLESAHSLFVETHGVFNPLVQISRLGYDKTFDQIKSSAKKNIDEPYDIDFTSVVIDKQNSRVKLQPGQKIDFGGFLKGYLAERLVSKFSDVSGIIINIGGDIATRGLDASGKEFVFDLFNPVTEKYDVSLTIRDKSLATSGTYKRRWNMSGKPVHHILDRFGMANPETDIVSASVVGDSGAKTEAYSKVLLSLDIAKTEALLGAQELQYVVVYKNGEVIKNI